MINKNNLILIGLMMLTGCTTTPNLQQKLAPYLDSFIGKTPEQVKSSVDFRVLNLESSHKPIQESANILVYRIIRPVRIPLPSHAVTSSGSISGPINVNAGSLAESYYVNFNCDISFKIDQNLISNWSYSGKAC